MSVRPQTIAFVSLVFLAMLFRLGLVIQAGGCRQDPDNYLPLARSLVAGEGYRINKKPTAYRPPLYPLVLAPLVRTTGQALPWAIGGLHVVLGGVTVMLTGAFVRRTTSQPSAPWLAMVLVAFDPVLAVQARGVMTETLAAALVAFTLWALSLEGNRGALLGGIGAGLATLCRPSLIVGAFLASFARLWFENRRTLGLIASFLLYWLAVGAVLAPWAVRNWIVLGEPVWSTTHGGYTLALANNPFYYADVLDGPPGAVWSGEHQQYWGRQIHRATITMSEPEADRAIQEGAIEFMRGHPEQVFRATIARLCRFWGVAPAEAVYARSLRVLTMVWTIPFWILLILGLAAPDSRGWPMLAAVMMVLGLTAVHCFFWTDLRMRAPIVPALAAIASVGVGIERWKQAKSAVKLGQNR